MSLESEAARARAGLQPRCYDRPPLPEGQWADTGRNAFPAHMLTPAPGRVWQSRRVLRFRWSPFSTGCKAWDAPRIEDSVPARERWMCLGCQHLPEHARAHVTAVAWNEVVFILGAGTQRLAAAPASITADMPPTSTSVPVNAAGVGASAHAAKRRNQKESRYEA